MVDLVLDLLRRRLMDLDRLLDRLLDLLLDNGLVIDLARLCGLIDLCCDCGRFCCFCGSGVSSSSSVSES